MVIVLLGALGFSPTKLGEGAIIGKESILRREKLAALELRFSIAKAHIKSNRARVSQPGKYNL